MLAAGEIDVSTSPELRETLAEAAETSERIILDLTRVRFLDSTGMSEMVQALHRKNQGQGCALCLVGPSGMVLRVLQVTQLTTLFPIYASLSEAIAQLVE